MNRWSCKRAASAAAMMITLGLVAASHVMAADAIILLDPTTDCAFSASGTGQFIVTGGGMRVNSAQQCAVCSNGTPNIIVPSIQIVGDACFSPNSTVQAVVVDGQPAVEDPLAGLPEPSVPGINRGVPPTSGEVVILPGYYPEGIARTGGTLICMPGLYYLDGAVADCGHSGFRVTGGNVFALNCIFFLKKGSVDFNGSGTFDISPPDPMEAEGEWAVTYEQVTFFQARAGNDCVADFNCSPAMSILGTLYFPSSHVCAAATGAGSYLANRLIANTAEFSGTGNLHIHLLSNDCHADITNDGQVNVSDLLQVLNAWNLTGKPGALPADVTADGVVDLNDLLDVINAWGQRACPQ